MPRTTSTNVGWPDLNLCWLFNENQSKRLVSKSGNIDSKQHRPLTNDQPFICKVLFSVFNLRQNGVNFKVSLQTYLKQTNLETKPSLKIQFLEEIPCLVRILVENFIFNWGDRWDFSLTFKRVGCTGLGLHMAWIDVVQFNMARLV